MKAGLIRKLNVDVLTYRIVLVAHGWALKSWYFKSRLPLGVADRPTRRTSHLLIKRAHMQGFIIFDHMDLYEGSVAQLADWVREGRLRYREDIL